MWAINHGARMRFWVMQTNIKDDIRSYWDRKISLTEVKERLAKAFERFDLPEGAQDLANEFRECEDEEDIDFTLSEAYDWADNSNVFLGI